jgi:Tfp pilus assembly protein PilF
MAEEEDLSRRPNHVSLQEQDLSGFDDFLSTKPSPPKPPAFEPLSPPSASSPSLADLPSLSDDLREVLEKKSPRRSSPEETRQAPVVPLDLSASDGLMYSKGKRKQPPLERASAPLPPSAPSQPVKSQQQLQALLHDLVTADEEANQALAQRFLIRRGEKQFGPFAEEEIFSMLNQRELDGTEELAPLSLDPHASLVWQTLASWPSFAPIVQWLEQQPLRVAMPGTRPPESIEAPHSKGAIAVAASHSWQQHRLAEKKLGFFQSWTGRLALAATILLAGSISLTFFLFRHASFRKTIKENQPLSILQRAEHLDEIEALRKLVAEALLAYQHQRKIPLWSQIRYAYQLFDHYGEERSMRADVEMIWRDLQKQPAPQESLLQVELARAISLQDKTELQRLFTKLRPKIGAYLQEASWVYLIARMFTLLGRQKPAEEIYEKICKENKKDARACWHLGLLHQRQSPKKSLALWLRAQQRAPEHLPTLLSLLEAGWSHDDPAWRQRIQSIRKKIAEVSLRLRYPAKTMTRLYLLEAHHLWVEGATQEAIRAVEKAAQLSPLDAHVRLWRARYLAWGGQAKQFIQEIRARPLHQFLEEPMLLALFFRMMQQQGMRNEWQQALRDIQRKGIKTPKMRYLTLYLQGQSAEMSALWKPAAQAYRQALEEAWRPAEPLASPALLRLLLQQDQSDEAKEQLATFKKRFPRSPETLYWEARLALHLKQNNDAHTLAKRLRQSFPRSFEGHLLLSELAPSPEKALDSLKDALWRGEGRILLSLKLLRALASQNHLVELLLLSPKISGSFAPQEQCEASQLEAETLAYLGRCEELQKREESTTCPTHPLYKARASCALRHRQAEEASRFFRKMLNFPKYKDLSFLGMASSSALQEKSSQAIASLRQALRYEPQNKAAWFLWLHLIQQEKDKAPFDAMRKRLQGRLPPSLDLGLQIALALRPYKEGTLLQRAARERLQKMLAKQKKSPEIERLQAFFNAAISLRDPAQTDRAKRDLRTLAKRSPAWRMPILALVEHALYKKDIIACRREIEETQRIVPAPSKSMRILLTFLYAACTPPPKDDHAE